MTICRALGGLTALVIGCAVTYSAHGQSQRLVVEILGNDKPSKTEALQSWSELVEKTRGELDKLWVSVAKIDQNPQPPMYRMLIAGVDNTEEAANLCLRLKSKRLVPNCAVAHRLVERRRDFSEPEKPNR